MGKNRTRASFVQFVDDTIFFFKDYGSSEKSQANPIGLWENIRA